MAEEHVGPRPAAWTKIFTGFKVALDLKKLLLAGAGILLTALGWWGLSAAAYNFYPIAAKPDWVNDYAHRAKTDKEKDSYWNEFKSRRASWNLLHELAGPGPAQVEPADVATSWREYEALTELQEAYRRSHVARVKVEGKDQDLKLDLDGKKYPFTIIADPKDAPKQADKLKNKEFPARDVKFSGEDNFELGSIDPVLVKVANGKDLREYLAEAADLPALRVRVQTYDEKKRATYEAALKTLDEKLLPHDREGRFVPQKPGGRLRALPWTEYRGENPYLLVTRLIKETSGEQSTQAAAVPRGHFLARFAELVPVLLEPLVKILTPIVYLFHRDADWYVRIYLILVLLWALAVWGFFGGAITRLAAVQIARNEKIPLREALLFAKDRFVSFFAAPAFPLLLLAVLVFCLWIFGWVEGLLPIFGDIVVAGLLWPIVLIVGLIMAVVLVGLVGWPLMNATVSVEGSDSFDALSRSYSYVYQAPWHYLWYGLVATLYGIVLVFFVGFMASLIVFLGKWGVSMTPGISSPIAEKDREPSYLFVYAPPSFGWRDLLIHTNTRFVEPRTELSPYGVPVTHYHFKDQYEETFTWYNRLGAILVAFWVGLFFLLVVGFGYSYFWTAATIIYFLMRRHVDDTDLDEVHLDEDEALDPFARPATTAPGAPAAPTPGAPKSDKVSLSVVEAPPPHTAVTPIVLPPIVPPPMAPPPEPPYTPPPPVTPPGLTISTPDEPPPHNDYLAPRRPDDERHDPPPGPL